jgi:hypothetical protein
MLHRRVARGLTFNMMETSFFVGWVKIVPAKKLEARSHPLPGLRSHAPQRAGRDGFLSHPPEPGHRTRQRGRDLSREERGLDEGAG